MSLEGRSRAVALADVRERLQRAGIEAAEAATEAELLLLHALGLSRAAFWAAARVGVRADEAVRLEGLLARRERRVPLQHLLGTVDFHHVTLAVEPGVFVPRPETETLVEVALEAVREAGLAEKAGRLIDLGTGTGAIAVALLRALPRWTGVAVDRSPAAIALAGRNAAANGVAARLTVVEADAFGAAGGPDLPPGPYELVVSNPPYIPSADVASLMPEVRDHDPREALDGGPDGLDAYRALTRVLPALAGAKSRIVLEIGDDQADRILGLPEWKVMIGARLETPRVRRDLAGRERVVVATWRGGAA